MKALEKKNTEQETKHARMIMLLERVVDCQENQIRHQKFEMGEQEKKFQQEMEDMQEVGAVQLREQEMEHRAREQEQEMEHRAREQEQESQSRAREQELKEMMEVGAETAERLKVEHDAKVHKLEEDNKVLKFEIEQLKVKWEESF